MTAIPFAIGGLLCPIIVIGVFIALVVLIIRSLGRSSARTSFPTQVRTDVATDLAADGFWIVNCPVPPGSMIHYSYWSGGNQSLGRVVYQPDASGRQFVYTGMRPDQISVIRILQPSDPGFSDLIVPGIIAADILSSSNTSDDSPPPPPPPPSAPSFPSAY